MENSLRVFVYVMLKNAFLAKWGDTELQISIEEKSTIISAASKRISQAKGFGYLGYEINSPLMYLNSGELVRLVVSNAYWQLFEPHFKGKKEIIQTKLEEIGIVRNSLAHFRPLKYDDIELIKQNIKHTFVGIEECLTEMTSTSNVVPTNKEDEWYKNLITLGTDLCKIQLYQSKREGWIRIEITYFCPIIEKRRAIAYAFFSALNLLSPAILKQYPLLSSLCTYVMEQTSYSSMSDEKDPILTKRTSLIFSRSVIEKDYENIASQLKELFLQIHNESELVRKDNLARGVLIEPARIYASRKEDKPTWTVYTNSLLCAVSENDPPEYWGDIGLYESDFIAGSNKYPWMPSDISKEEFPF